MLCESECNLCQTACKVVLIHIHDKSGSGSPVNMCVFIEDCPHSLNR